VKNSYEEKMLEKLVEETTKSIFAFFTERFETSIGALENMTSAHDVLLEETSRKDERIEFLHGLIEEIKNKEISSLELIEKKKCEFEELFSEENDCEKKKDLM
jgi:hypothetical protein